MTESLDFTPPALAEATAFRSTPSTAAPPRCARTKGGAQCTRIPARHTIFEVGDPADHLYCSSEASIVIYRPTREGRKTILDIVAPGRWFGFSNRSFHDCAAASAAPTHISAYGLVDVMAETSTSKRAFEDAVLQIDRLRKVASIRLGANTLERLAAFLLVQLAPDATEPARASMPLSRRDLADHLTTTVETLARNMSAMRRAAIIGKERRGEVDILDVDALHALAGGAVKLDADFLSERRAAAAQS